MKHISYQKNRKEQAAHRTFHTYLALEFSRIVLSNIQSYISTAGISEAPFTDMPVSIREVLTQGPQCL